MTEIEKEIEEMAAVILKAGIALDGSDFAYNSDHFERLATALHNAHYRPEAEVRAEVAKEFGEKINAELDKLKILTESPLVRRTEKQRLIGEGMKQALLDAIEIINELAEQFGKED